MNYIHSAFIASRDCGRSGWVTGDLGQPYGAIERAAALARPVVINTTDLYHGHADYRGFLASLGIAPTAFIQAGGVPAHRNVAACNPGSAPDSRPSTPAPVFGTLGSGRATVTKHLPRAVIDAVMAGEPPAFVYGLDGALHPVPVRRVLRSSEPVGFDPWAWLGQAGADVGEGSLL